MRERVVEKYLHTEVTKAGGTTYKFVSPGRVNVPDRIVIWPKLVVQSLKPPTRLLPRAKIDFAEIKAEGEKPRPGQAREHKRLRDLGCTVLVIDTKAKVDEYVELNR